jgi:hypothetical protein
MRSNHLMVVGLVLVALVIARVIAGTTVDVSADASAARAGRVVPAENMQTFAYPAP